MPTRPRIKDVAELAGVAPSTVSVVLNHAPGARVKDDTRLRVHRAADQLGYVPDPLARSLRTRRSRTVGLISDVIATTPYAGQLIQGAQDVAWRAGHLLILVNTGGDAELEQHAIRALRQQQVGGLLYATMWHRVVEIPPLLDGAPVVLLDAAPAAGQDRPHVIPDEEAGARAAVVELADHGHRRIGFVLDVGESPAGKGRLRGYSAALAEYGVRARPDWVVRGSSDSAGGEQAAGRLLDRADRPTAIFAFNDQMAVGVYHAAAARGLRIPEDLSVVGFDDLYVMSREMRPGLTTVALPHYAMGEVAARTLLDLVEEPQRPVPPRQLVACPLVRRGSVGPVPR